MEKRFSINNDKDNNTIYILFSDMVVAAVKVDSDKFVESIGDVLESIHYINYYLSCKDHNCNIGFIDRIRMKKMIRGCNNWSDLIKRLSPGIVRIDNDRILPDYNWVFNNKINRD